MTRLPHTIARLNPARRRYLAGEAVLVGVLLATALILRHSGGVAHVVALAALGYAVGLTSHLIAVVCGWQPRARRDRTSR